MTAPACPLTAAELRVMANWRKGVARDSSAALAKLNEARRPTGKAITDILALWLAASMEREAALRAELEKARTMTPELAHVLEAARESAYVDENEFPDKPWAKQTRDAIAAVRSQFTAKKEEPKP